MSPKKLDSFPERPKLGRPVGSKYDVFLDGDIWELSAGKDFQGSAARFVRTLRTHANSRRGLGLSAMIHLDGQTVIVQARKKR